MGYFLKYHTMTSRIKKLGVSHEMDFQKDITINYQIIFKTNNLSVSREMNL